MQGSDAVFVGTLAVARTVTPAGSLVELPINPALDDGAHFGFVTLAARTEAPALAIFRRFVAVHLRD